MHMAEQLRKRWTRIAQDFNAHVAYCREPATYKHVGNDVKGTLEAILSLFAAVQNTLLEFRSLDGESSQDMIDVLRDVFNTLRHPDWFQDARPANSRTYIGGAENFEYNLLYRFATFPSIWRRCVDVVGTLGDRYPGLFKQSEKVWQSAEYGIRSALAPRGQYIGKTGEFATTFYRQLADIGGMFDRSREQFRAK